MVNVLGVVVVDDEDDNGPVRLCFDWAIDGVRLRDLLEHESRRPVDENAAMWGPFAEERIDVLGGDMDPSRFGAGRVPVLTCSQGCDDECGAVTMEIVVADDRVHWRDFRWQEPLYRDPNDRGKPLHPLDLAFVFDRGVHETFLAELRVWMTAQRPGSVPQSVRRRWLRFGR